jgi:hypothetical protein
MLGNIELIFHKICLTAIAKHFATIQNKACLIGTSFY